MGPRGDTQSRHDQSAAPAPSALELPEPGRPAGEAAFAREAQAAAEARRRNSDQCAGAAAWVTYRLATGDWTLRRSRVLVVSSPVRPVGSGLDAAFDRFTAAVPPRAAENPVRERAARRCFQKVLEILDACSGAKETVSTSPGVDNARHPCVSTRDCAPSWEEPAIEHAKLAGLYLRAGNPEAAGLVIARALGAVARDVEKAAANGTAGRSPSADRTGAPRSQGPEGPREASQGHAVRS